MATLASLVTQSTQATNTTQTDSSDALYTQINARLDEITASFSTQLSELSTRLENSMNASLQSAQESMQSYVENEQLKLKQAALEYLESAQSEFNSTLDSLIETKVANALNSNTSLESIIDKSTIVDRVANSIKTIDLINEIKAESKVNLDEYMKNFANSISASVQTTLVNELKSTITKSDIISAITMDDSIKNDINDVVANQTPAMIQASINNTISDSNIQNDLNNALENIREQGNNLIKDAQTTLQNQADSELQNFRSKLQELYESSDDEKIQIQGIVGTALQTELSETLNNQIDVLKSSIIDSAKRTILENQRDLESEVINELQIALSQNIIDQVSTYFRTDEAIIARLFTDVEGIIMAELNDDQIKTLVTNLLKEQANEIFSGHELMQKLTQAQTLLCAMQMQSNLEGITTALDNISIDNKIQELALAKDQVKKELIAELKADHSLYDTLDSIKQSDQEQNNKIATLQSIDDSQNSAIEAAQTTIENQQTLIDALQLQIESLQNEIEELRSAQSDLESKVESELNQNSQDSSNGIISGSGVVDDGNGDSSNPNNSTNNGTQSNGSSVSNGTNSNVSSGVTNNGSVSNPGGIISGSQTTSQGYGGYATWQ